MVRNQNGFINQAWIYIETKLNLTSPETIVNPIGLYCVHKNKNWFFINMEKPHIKTVCIHKHYLVVSWFQMTMLKLCTIIMKWYMANEIFLLRWISIFIDSSNQILYYKWHKHLMNGIWTAIWMDKIERVEFMELRLYEIFGTKF